MLEISPHERRALRAQAHHLHPVVTIGQQGLTPTVLIEIDLALNAHGLIKVRVFVDDREEREGMFAEIADGLDAAPVQHIGKLFVLWRPQPEAEAAPAAPARATRGKTSAPKSREPARTAKAPPAHVARRGRGQQRTRDAGIATEGGAAKRSATQGDATKGAARGAGAPRGPSAPNPRRRRGTR